MMDNGSYKWSFDFIFSYFLSSTYILTLFLRSIFFFLSFNLLGTAKIRCLFGLNMSLQLGAHKSCWTKKKWENAHFQDNAKCFFFLFFWSVTILTEAFLFLWDLRTPTISKQGLEPGSAPCLLKRMIVTYLALIL